MCTDGRKDNEAIIWYITGYCKVDLSGDYLQETGCSKNNSNANLAYQISHCLCVRRDKGLAYQNSSQLKRTFNWNHKIFIFKRTRMLNVLFQCKKFNSTLQATECIMVSILFGHKFTGIYLR